MPVSRFSRRLKTMRQQREWTQAELATRAGLHRVFISELESGTHDPSLTTLAKLAKAFRVRSRSC
jgi:transcriptional regulator with XRE-family HTH domain